MVLASKPPPPPPSQRGNIFPLVVSCQSYHVGVAGAVQAATRATTY